MTRQQALQYVLNTGGGTTVAGFIEDWEPVGQMAWDDLKRDGLAYENEVTKHIHLTDAGVAKLKELKGGV